MPRFILNDKNGYAVAKAIEAGMRCLNAAAAQGLKLIQDYDSMPEWRLDELAWETNCLYDYNSDISTKRAWIRGATDDYRHYGTPYAIIKYLSGYFDHVAVEESSVYGGDPYHFRVIITGLYTEENSAWAQKAILASKNVRSILDSLTFNGGTSEAPLYCGAATVGIEANITSTML